MKVFRKVLELICQAGGGTVDGIAALTGVSREEVATVISELLASGILAESRGEECSSCPLKRFCPLRSCPTRTGLRMFYITDKGRKICERLREGGKPSS